MHRLLAVLAEPTAQMARVRAHLTDGRGRCPSRRTWERRLARLAGTLPTLIALLGAWLLRRLDPWPRGGRAVAIDSTCLRARGGVWHKKHREAGLGAAHQQRHRGRLDQVGLAPGPSGWGVRLEAPPSGDRLRDRLAARSRRADPGQRRRHPAGPLPSWLPCPPRSPPSWATSTTATPPCSRLVAGAGHLLLTTKRGAYPHTDDGVEVRRIFHQLRSHAIEHFNGQFKAIFDCGGAVPTRGLRATRLFALGAVLLYQLTLWHHAIADRDLRQGLTPFLRSA